MYFLLFSVVIAVDCNRKKTQYICICTYAVCTLHVYTYDMYAHVRIYKAPLNLKWFSTVMLPAVNQFEKFEANATLCFSPFEPLKVTKYRANQYNRAFAKSVNWFWTLLQRLAIPLSAIVSKCVCACVSVCVYLAPVLHRKDGNFH